MFPRKKPKILLSLHKKILRFFKSSIIKETLGIKLCLNPKDWIDNRLLAEQPYEYDQLEYVYQLIKWHDIKIFYDCGANIGLYTCFIGGHCSWITDIYTFEPVPSVYERLKRNIELNSIKAHVRSFNIALGESQKTIPITYFDYSSGTSTFDNEGSATRQKKEKKHIEIAAKMLPADDIAIWKDQKIFIKIDVEGSEMSVIEGMSSLLKDNLCFIQVELWDNHLEPFIKKMKSLKYKLIRQIGNDYYFMK